MICEFGFRYAYSKQDSKCLPYNTQWIRTGFNDELKGIIKIVCSNDIRASNLECDRDPDSDLIVFDYDENDYIHIPFPEYCVRICQESVSNGGDPEFASSAVRKPIQFLNNLIWSFTFFKNRLELDPLSLEVDGELAVQNGSLTKELDV